ncbi:MAG TPA: ABC transporter permease [Caproiciproducens sp.]|nr:ABC transporter permease [Caproiciproducens sp.]
MKTKKAGLYLLALSPFFLLILFFEIAPLFTVIFRSFLQQDSFSFTLQNYSDIFGKKLYRQAVWNSILVSAVSALAGILISFFGAKASHNISGRLRSFFISILNMTANFAGIPLAFAYIILLGNVGVLIMIGKKYGISFLTNFNLYSIEGLMLTYVYFQIPLATLLLLPAFDGIHPQWRESVELLGGGGFSFWFRVGIPVLMPSILGTIGVLFANSLAAYATAYALLQNNFSLLPIRLQEQFTGDIVQNKAFGSALAVILMLLMVLAIGVNNTILKKSRRTEP